MKNLDIKNQKGITLVALVITIIILLILAGVSISIVIGENSIINIAKDSKIQAEMSSIKEKIQTDILEKQAENNGNISDDSLKEILEKYGALSEEESLLNKTLTTSEGNYKIKVSDILNGTSEKEKTDDPVMPDTSGANAPNLSKIAQKTYVTWNLNEAKTEYVINDTQTTKPNDWYNYENGKWANIKTTNRVSDTETFEAYWVWIPRYEYVVPTSTNATQIEVKFISKDQKTPDTNKNYVIHPAFTWKELQSDGSYTTRELDGIWVAKFESSSNTTSPDKNYGGGNDPSLKVQVKPGVQSWRNISTNNIFSVCRKMTGTGEVLAGSTVDSHMMKNIEWGAVAILSQSKYGIYNPKSSTGPNGDSTYQIWNNPNGYNGYKNIYTGYAGDSKDAATASNATSAKNVIEYNKKNTNGLDGTKASTTGTVYGVYDMAGGSWEYVAGCVKDQENSKFGVTNGDDKYVDLYASTSNTDYSKGKIGDATKETKNWNDDFQNFIFSFMPVFIRSGACSDDIGSGAFAFGIYSGIAYDFNSFRVVLVP